MCSYIPIRTYATAFGAKCFCYLATPLPYNQTGHRLIISPVTTENYTSKTHTLSYKLSPLPILHRILTHTGMTYREAMLVYNSSYRSPVIAKTDTQTGSYGSTAYPIRDTSKFYVGCTVDERYICECENSLGTRVYTYGTSA